MNLRRLTIVLKIMLVFGTILPAFSVKAQADSLLLICHLFGDNTGMDLPHSKVEVFKNDKLSTFFETDDAGVAVFPLPLGIIYDFIFSSEGYMTKTVRIDTYGIPEENRAGGFMMELDIELFSKVAGFNEDILAAPVGIARYDAEKDALEFDGAYSEEIRKKIDNERKRISELRKSKKQP